MMLDNSGRVGKSKPIITAVIKSKNTDKAKLFGYAGVSFGGDYRLGPRLLRYAVGERPVNFEKKRENANTSGKPTVAAISVTVC